MKVANYMAKKSPAESRSRTYTINELHELAWDTRHPINGGQVLEEQEGKNYDTRLEELLLKDRPDFLIYHNNEPIIVIENKNDKDKLNQALNQAEYYAMKLSQKYFNVRVISGVAGDEAFGAIVRTYYYNNNKEWVEVLANNYPLTQFLTLGQYEQLINNNGSIDIDIPSEQEFYRIAEKINEILHEAKVNKSDRALYLGAIVLSMKMGKIPNDINTIIPVINTYIELALNQCGKGKLIPLFKIKGNSIKLKEKLPIIFHHLDRLNIQALMNTGDDVLGKFFETFLKYGNDSKELGIVFTPRHIAKFVCDLVDLQPTDIVYDPACGTGGFLVSAFSKMKDQLENNQKALINLKLHQIIGCDSEDSGKIPALAVVNMIFRGDGRSNIYNENCFTFDKFGSNHFATKVLMNPPYSLKDEPETMFIDYALRACKEGGTFAAILPCSVLCQKSLSKWRKSLISNHTIDAVITMPGDLFAPTNVNTCIIICKAHIPHNNKKVFFARIDNDGYIVKRKKRIEKLGSQLPEVLKYYRLKNIEENANYNIKGFMTYRKLDESDLLVELVPEAYLDSPDYNSYDVNALSEQLMREYLSFNFKYYPYLNNINKSDFKNFSNTKQFSGNTKLSDIFVISYGMREIHSKEHLEIGCNSVISSSGTNDGLYGFFDLPPGYTDVCISIPNTGSIGMSYVQEYNCSIDDNCLVLIPKNNIKISIEELYYICAYLRMDVWRYRYGRQITELRIKDILIDFSLMNFNILHQLKGQLDRYIKDFEECKNVVKEIGLVI